MIVVAWLLKLIVFPDESLIVSGTLSCNLSSTIVQPIKYKSFLETTQFFCDILREMKIPTAPKSEWLGTPQKKISQLLNYGKRMITPESVSEFLRIQKNEITGGDE